MARRLGLCTLVLALGLGAWPAGAALADGDPASDVLLGADVFYPYGTPVSPALQRTLNAETAAAARGHFHLKVALIDGPHDLGAVPQLFGKPQGYAKFLVQELRLFLGPHPLLLVVMPGGYGVEGLPPAATSAAASLPKPGGHASNDLAEAAAAAVPKLAAAAGHPIPARYGSQSGAGGGGSDAVWIVIGVVLALIAAAGAVLVIRHRLARPPGAGR